MMKKSLLCSLFTLIVFSAFAQTYNNGQWYSLYNEGSLELNTISNRTQTFSYKPIAGTLSFKWKYTKVDLLGVFPVNNTHIYESADGGGTMNEIGTLTKEEWDQEQSFSCKINPNTNFLKWDRPTGNTHKITVYQIEVPIAKHIYFDDGSEGTTTDKSKDFGSLTWGDTSEPYHIALHSFYVNGDITITSDIPDVFRIGSADNTEGLTYAIGKNALADKNGNGEAGGSNRGQISNYDFDIYFCPQEGKEYNGIVTISDGTNSLKINISGTGLKKDQTIGWEQTDGTFLSDAVLAAAKASSGLDIAYTFEPEGIISASEGALNIIGTGNVTVTAAQTGSTRFNAATAISKTFTIHPAITYNTIDGYVCEGSEYDYLGNLYTKGSHEIHIPNVWDGDSTITLNVKANPVYAYAKEITMYENQNKTWRGKDLSAIAVGTHTIYDSLLTVSGCDSVYTLTLTVKEKPNNGTAYSATICQGDTYSDDNFNELTETNDYTLTLKNYLGGDSIITLSLTVNPAYSFTDEITMYENQDKTWHGKDLSAIAVGTHTIYDSLLTISGCDSVYTLTLTVKEKPNNSTAYSATICQGNTYSDDNFNELTETNDYTLTLKNYLGGDSIITLSLTVNPAYSFTDEITMYENQDKTWHGKDLSAIAVGTHTIYDSLLTISGCDSVYTLTLTVKEKPNNSTAYSATICQGNTYSDDNFNELTETNDYTLTLKNYLGGDSIITLSLTVNPAYSFTDEITMYENQDKTWHGKDLSAIAVGTHTIYDSLLTISGCDSVYTLTLTVKDKPNNNTAYSATICQGDTYSDDNFNELSEAKDYNITLTNQYGGDSIITLTLSYAPTYFFQEEKVMYVGEEGTWHNINLALQPVGFQTLMDENATTIGCDSTYMLSLTVIERPTTYYFYEATICANETYTDENFAELNEAKDYTLTLTNYLGSDSIITLTLIVLPVSAATVETTVTYGTDEWIALNDTPDAGEYESQETGISSLGCDSVTTYLLTILQAEQTITWTPDTTVLTVGETLNLNAYSTSGLDITYSIDNKDLAEITDNILTATASGTIIVTLSQEGDNNYLAAEPVSVEISILNPAGLNETTITKAKATKQVKNGHLYIITQEAVYTAEGVRVK